MLGQGRVELAGGQGEEERPTVHVRGQLLPDPPEAGQYYSPDPVKGGTGRQQIPRI